MTYALNEENKTSLKAYINRTFGFIYIADIIEKTMNSYNVKYNYTVEDLLNADKWARNAALDFIINK